MTDDYYYFWVLYVEKFMLFYFTQFSIFASMFEYKILADTFYTR